MILILKVTHAMTYFSDLTQSFQNNSNITYIHEITKQNLQFTFIANILRTHIVRTFLHSFGYLLDLNLGPFIFKISTKAQFSARFPERHSKFTFPFYNIFIFSANFAQFLAKVLFPSTRNRSKVQFSFCEEDQMKMCSFLAFPFLYIETHLPTFTGLD